MDNRILVAMSGGVDSTVAAYLLKKQYTDIAGITMRVWSDTEVLTDGDCSSLDQNCIDAEAVCGILGIPHFTVSLGDSFRRDVIDSFLHDYINGLTPNPCVECNKKIKFGKLLEQAQRLEYNTLATGHYVRTVKNGDGIELRMAKDKNKDQSYFLWGINKSILPRLIFPLGDYTKEEIRTVAEQKGFENAHRSDSQDICFIEDGKYAEFIAKYCDHPFPHGDFIDIDGKKIGTHNGIINYTIGQRKGLGIAFGKPMFVGRKSIADNTVMLCTNEQLYSDTLTARSINLLISDTLETPVRLQAKIRYRHTPAIATVQRSSQDTLSVKFDLPQRAIAPGQSLVLYDGDTVIGGGIIQ